MGNTIDGNADIPSVSSSSSSSSPHYSNNSNHNGTSINKLNIREHHQQQPRYIYTQNNMMTTLNESDNEISNSNVNLNDLENLINDAVVSSNFYFCLLFFSLSLFLLKQYCVSFFISD